MQDVWSVQDGLLTCTGKPAGDLITEKSDFHDYRLTRGMALAHWQSGQ